MVAHGIRALLGLAISLALVIKFLVPAILAGRPPLLVALIGSLAVMIVTVLISHGFGVKSLAAILGTGGGARADGTARAGGRPRGQHTVTLTATGEGGGHGAPAVSTGAPATTAPATTPAAADDNGGSDTLAVVALIIGALGLIAGVAGLLLARRATRQSRIAA
jgi:YibE/F-like protein